MESNKITVRQFMAMFIVACLSPATRMMPVVVAKTAKHAGWVSVIIGALFLVAIFAVFSGIFRHGDNGPSGLGDAFELAFGKVPAKVIMAVYLVWTSFIFLLYIRYYAERMLLTIFSTTNIRFFIAAMMTIVFFALRGPVKVLARFSEISVLVFTIVIIVITVGLLPSFEIKNVWPVTHLDAVPVMKGSFQIFSVYAIVGLFFFLGEFVKGKHEIWKSGKKTALILGTVLTIITVLCIGTLSYRLAANMPMPFFTAVKLIAIVEPLSRIEALLFSAWVITDFIVITAFALIICSISKRLFGVGETRHFAAPLALFGYVGGIAIAVSVFELESFSEGFVAPVMSLVLSVGIPLITMTVGRLRKRI